MRRGRGPVFRFGRRVDLRDWWILCSDSEIGFSQIAETLVRGVFRRLLCQTESVIIMFAGLHCVCASTASGVDADTDSGMSTSAKRQIRSGFSRRMTFPAVFLSGDFFAAQCGHNCPLGCNHSSLRQTRAGSGPHGERWCMLVFYRDCSGALELLA